MTRLVTAIVLTSGVLACLFFLEPAQATACFALFLFAAALEWANMANFKSVALRISYAAVIVSLALLLWQIAATARPFFTILATACGWWLIAGIWIIHFQLRRRPAIHNSAVLAVLGVLVLAPALAAIGYLLARGPWPLLALFIIVWSADILAYFGGRRFGRAKLATHISPGKTWAGFYSAVLGTVALGLIVNAWFLGFAPGPACVIIVVTVLASVIGDLFESLLKRWRGLKDSGRLLPGHGGMLDRIDSLLAAAPVFAVTLRYMGYA